MTGLAWVTSVSSCLAFLMTSLTVTARLSLLWLLRLYKYEQIHPATWYTIVFILLVTPHVTQLIYIVWDTPILSPANRQTLPFFWNILMGILSSILEGSAMVVFASEVTPVLPEPVLLTIPYAVLAFSVISDVLTSSDKPKHTLTKPKDNADDLMTCSGRRTRLGLGIYLLIAPLAVGVLLYTGYHFRVNRPEFCSMVISLVILSAVWNPVTQKAIIRSRSSEEKCPMAELIYIPTKIISTMVAVFLCAFCKFGAMVQNPSGFLSNVSSELNGICILAPIVLCLASCFLGMMAAMASSKLGLVAAGIKVPFFLCPILTVGASIAIWHDFRTDAFWELSGEDFASWSTIVLSGFVWFIPFFFPTLKLLKSPSTNGRSFNNSFISFSWNVIFLEPRTALNYESVSFNKFDCVGNYRNSPQNINSKPSKSNPKTIFLCTTMYKENEREMERYINSIKDVFDNIQDDTLNIEAHVLFDGAVENATINVRARQLLALLSGKFGLKPKELIKRATPYGCQIHTGNHLKHTVCVHLKDSTLVKNKKRWSQVMYLNYILQFRYGHKNAHAIDSNFVSLSALSKNFEEIGEHNFLENPHYEIGNGSQSLKNGGHHDNACTISDMELFQIQAEYARIKRRLSEKVNPDSRNPETKSIPCINAPLNNCNNTTSSSSKMMQNLNRGMYVSNTETKNRNIEIEDRLIKTWNQNGSYSEPKNHVSLHKIKKYNQELSATSNSKSFHNDKKDLPCLDDVYILATDADTAFSAKSVLEVLTQCQSNPSLGAICGRTEPVGSPKPIVWYQKFEYAKDFWLVKASQNVIGSVTCCPGCFSLYRGSALVDVLREFSQPTTSGFDSLVKDHGEDRWLCTLLMQRGWRLAYNAHAHNSTHCPETVGEFLRQRRRWVLSELSNMLSIFINVLQLVRHNASFSGMFLLSLFMTFLWIILCPATTLVFLCAGGDVLYSVPLTFTLPFAAILFLAYATICCTMSQSRQKIASLLMTVAMATVVLILSAGFVVYVVNAMQRDINTLDTVQFRPYFLVFLLILATIYAAVLHPRESLSLVYGLTYALLFPSIFVVLPVYSLTNMVDQSWGTREPGSHSCCQNVEEEIEDDAYEDFQISTNSLTSLSEHENTKEEFEFWESLKNYVIGHDVNIGKAAEDVSSDLAKLRRTSVILLLIANITWSVLLSLLYVYAGSDVICYCVASVFSFSFVLQLVGLTCYRINSMIDRYLRAHDLQTMNFGFNTGDSTRC